MSHTELARLFHGRNCLVTGATGDIGFAVARLLVECGANVYGQSTGRKPEKDAACASELLQKAKDGKVILRAFDLTDDEACHSLVKEAYGNFSRFDHVFICHGIYFGERDIKAQKITRADARRLQMQVNLLSVDAICTSIFQRQTLLPSEGRHIQLRLSAVTSTAARGSRSGDIEYAASKGAAQAALVSRRKAGLEIGIRVSVVAPGPVLGQMTSERAYAASELLPPSRLAEQILTIHDPKFDESLAGEVIEVRMVNHRIYCTTSVPSEFDLSTGDR